MIQSVNIDLMTFYDLNNNFKILSKSYRKCYRKVIESVMEIKMKISLKQNIIELLIHIQENFVE